MLHGELKVNGHAIGDWQAIRKEETLPGQHRYNTVLNLYAGQGVGQQRMTVGSVVHTYTDGAAVLASKVLLTGSDQETPCAERQQA
jgi:hypothetical protein